MLATQNNLAVRHDLMDRILEERLFDARRRSDELFQVVCPEALYDRPIPQRHRIIFYLGHLEAFDWNLLHENSFGLKSFHPDFDRLFAFGIDPVGSGLPSDKSSDWPSLESVEDYVARIRTALDEKIAGGISHSSAETSTGFSLETLINVAIEHRLMHVETLAYMLHQLPLDRKVRPVAQLDLIATPVTARMVEIPAGVATLGLSRNDESFGWDNEYESHTVQVPAFEIDEYKVTNRQYLEFMAAGGYETPAYWSDNDWQWKTTEGISHPVFWAKTGAEWRFRTMFEEIPLPLDWPVYVSHAEATAYARWTGKSLPAEEQWHRAAYGTNETENIYPWGNEAPGSKFGNFDFARWNPTPVNAFPQGRSTFGVHDMLGNGWEWTSTVFGPFAGFKPFPFYRGYSADFFDGKHFVMKGGSARTAACMLRPTFRNWFQSHYPYVYSGFRCVSN